MLDTRHMRRALELAKQGEGLVEPNPMVGCVIVSGDEIVGEGWHRRFGGPHAEVEALRLAASDAAGATMFVTSEPCCHHGKTPPCSEAIIRAGLRRVVIAQRDPFPEVDGGGIARLEAAGIRVEVGLLEAEARRLNAPYFEAHRDRPALGDRQMGDDALRQDRHANGLEPLDLQSRVARDRPRPARPDGRDPCRRGNRPAGRSALDRPAAGTANGDSRGPRQPGIARRSESRLVATARDVPVLVAAGPEASEADRRRLAEAGCEVFVCEGDDRAARLDALLAELGRRRLTNVLVEGGGRLLGSLFDAGQVDEVHAFIAPKLVGGADAPTPIAGAGLAEMSQALVLDDPVVCQVGSDVYVSGRVCRPSTPA